MLRRVPIVIVAAALLAAGTAATLPASASKTVAASQTLTLAPGETLTIRCPTPHESWNHSGYPLVVTCPAGATTTTQPPIVTRTAAPTTTTLPVTSTTRGTTTTVGPTSTTRAVTTTTSAPSSVFRLFGPTSLWNTVKDPTNFATSATRVIESIDFGLNNGAYDHPFYIAKTTDPMTTFHLGSGWGHAAETITANAPAGMQQASGGDEDMDVLLTNGTLLDMYGVTGSGTNWTAEYYGTSDGINGPGFGGPPTYADYYAIGTTAIGSPQAGGTILASDVAAGTIPHGLTMACDYDYEGGNGTSNSAGVAPAVSNDDGNDTGGPGPGPLPEGGLLFIPSGTQVPSGLSAMGKQLWNAAATYGVYITDQAGGGCYFYGDGSSAVGNAFTSADLNDVGHALELVDTWQS